MAAFGEALGLLKYHGGHGDVSGGGLVEGARDHFAVHAALHIGHLLRAFVDQQHDEVGLRMVGGDGVGHVLQQDRLTRLGLCDDQAALAFADRGEEVQYAGAEVAALGGEVELFVGEERREELEGNAVARPLGVAAVDALDLHQREELVLVARRAHVAVDGVSQLEAGLLDLLLCHIDIVR